MKERIKVPLPARLRKTIEEKELNPSEWLRQAIKLGFLVEKGEIFRKLGDDYHALEMKDINPYPTTLRVKSGERVEVINIPQELATEIEKASQFETKGWLNRVLTLRLMAEDLNLLTRRDDEFVRISFD